MAGILVKRCGHFAARVLRLEREATFDGLRVSERPGIARQHRAEIELRVAVLIQ